MSEKDLDEVEEWLRRSELADSALGMVMISGVTAFGIVGGMPLPEALTLFSVGAVWMLAPAGKFRVRLDGEEIYVEEREVGDAE